jgi:hypothetical protein
VGRHRRSSRRCIVIQRELLAVLAESRTDERYLAGGAALHFAPNSTRFVAAKQTWLAALESAEILVRSRPPEEIGCLYWSSGRQAFVIPEPGAMSGGDVTPHFGAPGGVLPRVVEG